MDDLCSILGCERPVRGRGWCQAHYMHWYRHGDPLAGRVGEGPGRPTTDPLEKLLARIVVDENGCWIAGRLGMYAQVYAGSETDGTDTILHGHRVMWEFEHGPQPTGTNVHHLCEQKPCIHPDHLELLDHADHARLHYDEPDGLRYTKPKPTHCPQGHPYSGDNLYIRPGDGARQCWTCIRARKQRRRVKRALNP